MKIAIRILLVLVVIALLGAALAWGGYQYARHRYGPELPPVSRLEHIHLGAPLRVYTADGKLIGQFGEQRRLPLTYNEIPKRLRQAFLAAEDSNFFHHGAVDWPAMLRAAFVLVTTGQKKQGGSTIAMQLARDLFLSPKKTYVRKIKEILLAQRLERTLSKKQILTLYLNRVFLGHRAYGVGAAAQAYYGRDVDKLTLNQMATLAGLPKAPSRDNPIASPHNARIRRDYVLGRMRDLDDISQQQYQQAMMEPVVAHEHSPSVEASAPYVAEMVRAEMVNRYGRAVYDSGDSVTTTINSKEQAAATAAVRAGLLAYTERHGYNGAEARLPSTLLAEFKRNPQSPAVRDTLDDDNVVGGLIPAAVISFSPQRLRLETENGAVTLHKKAFAWAKLDGKNHALQTGDIVRLAHTEHGWQLAQIPQAQGALVALDPRNGAIRALVGGFDFYANKFNRVIQAQRQVGSGFKPYYYTAALAKGYTPASVFLDAPVVQAGSNALQDTWRPHNDNNAFGGPMRMRVALEHSVNLVSIRILRAIGVDYARDFIAPRFGIPKSRIPDNLTAALGTAALTPLEQARGYAVFANGGFLIKPYFIARITSSKGKVLFQANPAVACPKCADPATSDTTPPNPTPASSTTGVGGATAPRHAPRTISPVDDYLITSMLHSVIQDGTGRAAKALGRHDLCGKTGTTNDQTNAWFNGFNPSLVAVAWVGFDQPKTLGYNEYGARAALPIWMAFMKRALADKPELTLPEPPGIVSVQIDPKTGKAVDASFPGAISEIVQKDHVPPPQQSSNGSGSTNNPTQSLY